VDIRLFQKPTANFLVFWFFDEMKEGAGLVEAVRKSLLGYKASAVLWLCSEREPGVVVGVP